MAPSGKTSAPERASDKEKALETALLQIERQFGKGSIMRLGEETRDPGRGDPHRVDRTRRRPRHRRPPARPHRRDLRAGVSGKTTLALHAIANAQKAGGIAAFIDAEHALDPEYAQKLGVDTDALLVSQPDTGEQALEIADMLVRSGAVDVIVIDSVAALVPKAEIEGEMGDSHVGLQARLMSQALRKITGALSHDQHHVHLHQPAPREDRRDVRLARDHHRRQGAQVLRVGAARHPADRDAQGRDRGGRQPDAGQGRQEQDGPPFKHAEFDILYGIGISREGSLIDLGVEQDIVRKSGAWYTYDGDQLGQGKENARNFLRDNDDVANEIEKKIKEKLGVGPRLDSDPAATAKPPAPAPAPL